MSRKPQPAAASAAVQKVRCAVYTRKSTDEGLEKEFNSLDAQRESCEAYITSQRAEGWVLVPDRYDDGGVSGGTLERPALQRLLGDIERDRIDVVVVYKIDRLSRSLMHFSKLVEAFDAHNVTFVSVTYMRDTILAVLRALRGRLGRSPAAEELFAEVWPQYSRKADLSRPGRGADEVMAKIRYTLRRVEAGAVASMPPTPPQAGEPLAPPSCP